VNGLSLNGVAVEGREPLSHGDLILWGKSPNAPLSRVKIG
jgi:hypothetical protein